MAVKKMGTFEKEAFAFATKRMEGETFESLTKRGRGVYLEQLCSDFGLSEYGTTKAKAERLLKFYGGLKK